MPSVEVLWRLLVIRPPEPEVPEGGGRRLSFPSCHPGPDPGSKSFQENPLS